MPLICRNLSKSRIRIIVAPFSPHFPTTEKATTDEVQRIFTALEHEPLKWRALMRLLIDTGIRRGECCGLQWKDIDAKAGTITIRGNLCYTPQKGIYLDTPKSGKVRTIDVDPEIIGLPQQLRLEQTSHAISTYVFTQQNSPEPMHPQSPARYMQKFSKKYDVPGLHPHKLRHPNVKPKTKIFLPFRNSILFNQTINFKTSLEKQL